MWPVSSIVVLLLISSGLFGNFNFCFGQQLNQCYKKNNPTLVYNEKGNVTVTAILDLSQGPLCNQSNVASLQSMNGLLQTVHTLNSIQYLKGLKIGIRMYDSCSQESLGLQAVLESALDANLTNTCRSSVHLGFLFSLRSYPSVVQLLSVLNLPFSDISYWQTTSPLDAVADLLIRLKWSSIAVISQSKQTLSLFSKKASDRSICIVAQSVLSPINRTKETTVRAVRRAKRSGSKIYVLIGSSEFLLHVLPFFQGNSSNSTPSKYVLVAADSWFGNFSKEIGNIAQEALIVRPQRVLSDDNISARVLYSLVKQFKNHLSSACNGQVFPCDFEPHHLMKKMVLAEDDLKILKLSKDISIYNELFPVSYISKKNANGDHLIIDIGNIHEDKFIPVENFTLDREEISDCTDCLCTNVDFTPSFILQIRNELYIFISGGFSLLAILLALTGLIFMMYIQCCSAHEDRSGNFIFLILTTVLILLLSSLLFLLVPSSILCLSRVIAVSGAYVIFLASLLTTIIISLIAKHPGNKCSRIFLQFFIFLLTVGVQVPILTYETLFRDETLLINKVLTDFGPTTECILEDILALKLFIYPTIILFILTFGSILVLYNHWQVSAIKLNLGISTLFCCIINVAWGVCYFMLDKHLRDLVILSGIQGNAYVILIGVAIPKIVNGMKNINNTYPPKSWQEVDGNRPTTDGLQNHSILPIPPVRPHQHIYAIPHEYDRDRRELDRRSESNHSETTDNQSTAM